MGEYTDCVAMCSKKHPGFHPVKQQKCITDCLNVPGTAGMIPFVPIISEDGEVVNRDYWIVEQPMPESVVGVVDRVRESDPKAVAAKIMLTAGLIAGGLIAVNALSKGLGKGIGKGLAEKI